MMSEVKRKYYEASSVAQELGHSPLPWSIADRGRKSSSELPAMSIESYVPISGGIGMTVASIFYYKSFEDKGIPRSIIETNARMIIDRVNSWEGLVKALQDSADWFHDTHRNIFGPDFETCDHGQCVESRTALNPKG